MNTTTRTKLRNKWRALGHEERRALIVDVAMDMLTHKGMESITMRQVAEKLGLGVMTLYTYVQGQDELRRAMITRGFDMLHQGCHAAGQDAPPDAGWQAGARSYVRFALENPALYHLMFSTPIKNDSADRQVITGGFAPLYECVSEQMAQKGFTPKEIQEKLPIAVARFWIALHGLASLSISGRLQACDLNINAIIEDLFNRVAPV